MPFRIKDLCTGDLVLVLVDNLAYRGIIDSTGFLNYEDEATSQYAGTLQVKLGAGRDGSLSVPVSRGEEIDAKPEQIIARVALGDDPEPMLGTKYDWLTHCLRACEWCETQMVKAPWDQILEKPYNWGNEAWLGGHDVLADIEYVIQ